MSPVEDRWALVLAGGKGTRLAAAVPDRPKILAPINGRPFLDFLIDELGAQGIGKLAFLLGFRHREIVDALEATLAASRQARGGAASRHARGSAATPQSAAPHAAGPQHAAAPLQIEWSIEPAPLGTAGAVKHAARYATSDFFLINGDTYLPFDAERLLAVHQRTGAAVTLAAARVDDASRYGSLEVDATGRVTAFREKVAPAAAGGQTGHAAGSAAGEQGASGLINGGVYVMAPRVLDLVAAGKCVSLETEIFPELLASGERVSAVEQAGPFFDIGTESSWKAFARYAAEKRPLAAPDGDGP